MQKGAEVLLIDDDANYRRSLSRLFRANGITVDEAEDAPGAKYRLDQKRYTYVLIDHEMHGERVGLKLAQYCLSKGIRDFAIVTGHEDDDTAIEFFKLGIKSFYPKSKFVKTIDSVIRRVRSLVAIENHEELFSRQFVTQDEPLINEIKTVATSFSNKAVFISGETGVGKTEVAKLIHVLSGATGKFVHLNCAQTEDSMIESVLFGHKRGAFTGATSDVDGKLALAENGTLFLDEIGNLSPRAQEKLLLAIEERRFFPLGSNQERKADFQLISATKEDLLQLVKANRFRNDLFYRVMGINLNISPLRQRSEDVPLLVRLFLSRLPSKILIADEAMELLKQYSWPGNVRELKNVVDSFERMPCGYITPDMLSVEIQKGLLSATPDSVLTADQYSMIQSIGLSRFIEMMEQEALKRSLTQNNWKQITASNALKITKTMFYRIYRGMTHEHEPSRPGLTTKINTSDERTYGAG